MVQVDRVNILTNSVWLLKLGLHKDFLKFPNVQILGISKT